MMNEYDEKIFDFLTKEENFSSACEVAEHFEWIKKRLINDFWSKVESSLNKKVKEQKKNWEIQKEGELTDRYSKLGFWFAEGDLRVIFENLSSNNNNTRKKETYYGLWIHHGKTKILDEEKIVDYSKEIKEEITMTSEMPSNAWWLFWDYTGRNFSQLETLIKILPRNRNDLIIELTDTLFDFAVEMEEHILKMSKMVKK